MCTGIEESVVYARSYTIELVLEMPYEGLDPRTEKSRGFPV